MTETQNTTHRIMTDNKLIKSLLESALESNKHKLYMDVRECCTEIKELIDME